jgi:hypothetical protein
VSLALATIDDKINLNKKPNKTKTKSAPARASERLKNRNK